MHFLQYAQCVKLKLKAHVQVCREWEAAARQVNQEDVRLVLLRIGVVLGKDGGALGWRFSFHSMGHLSFLHS